MIRGVIFLLLFFSASATLQAEIRNENPDFNLEVSSLTNQTRAYELRVKSMETLVSRSPERVFPLLISLFTNPTENPPLRYLAAERLRAIHPQRAQRTFLEILEDRKQDVLARRISLAQLVVVNEPPLRQRVLGILDDRSEDPALRQYALGIYSGWPDRMDRACLVEPRMAACPSGPERGKIEKLRGFVETRREPLNMRSNALFLLESLQDFDFVRSRIHEFLTDPKASEELRKNAIVMAERMKDGNSVPLLVHIAQDDHESSSLRQLARATLGRMAENPSH